MALALGILLTGIVIASAMLLWENSYDVWMENLSADTVTVAMVQEPLPEHTAIDPELSFELEVDE